MATCGFREPGPARGAACLPLLIGFRGLGCRDEGLADLGFTVLYLEFMRGFGVYTSRSSPR